jgi:hypothetical protein
MIGLGVMLISTYINLDKENLKLKEYLMPFFGLGTIFFALYSIYKYYKNAPIIIVDNEKILFNDEIYKWTELKKIKLTGKQPFPYIINYMMEAASIEFKDGRKKIIFDDLYSNTWQIKSFLQQKIINKKDFSEIETQIIDSSILKNEYFTGNQFVSFRGLSLWILIGVITYIGFLDSKIPSISFCIFYVLSISFWFFFNSYLMYNFRMSDKYFVIKNHNFFWTNKIYAISDIIEIIFEQQGKAPNCLRIITKDFKNEIYPAGTLRDKTWLDLQDRLESYKIKVRNECVWE